MKSCFERVIIHPLSASVSHSGVVTLPTGDGGTISRSEVDRLLKQLSATVDLDDKSSFPEVNERLELFGGKMRITCASFHDYHKVL